jgi:small conductance mechanosensitive channel
MMDFSKISDSISSLATQFGWKLLGAAAVWVIGGWLIKIVVKLTERAMNNQKVDKTLVGYVGSTMTVTLKILLVIGILSILGIETTSFAALLAATGLAIGAAWSGLLSNFAAGAFLVILRPFKTGDIIAAGGVTGMVEEIGLFTTTICDWDGVRTFVGNNKIFSDNIQNYSTKGYRHIHFTAQLDHSADHNLAMQMLKERLIHVPKVLPEREIEIGILNFTTMGPVLEIKLPCLPEHSEDIRYDANRAIRETLGDGGFQVPKQHFAMKSLA